MVSPVARTPASPTATGTPERRRPFSRCTRTLRRRRGAGGGEHGKRRRKTTRSPQHRPRRPRTRPPRQPQVSLRLPPRPQGTRPGRFPHRENLSRWEQVAHRLLAWLRPSSTRTWRAACPPASPPEGRHMRTRAPRQRPTGGPWTPLPLPRRSPQRWPSPSGPWAARGLPQRDRLGDRLQTRPWSVPSPRDRALPTLPGHLLPKEIRATSC